MALKLRTQIHPFSAQFEDSVIPQDSVRNIFDSLHTGTAIERAVILVEDEVIKDNYDRIPADGSRVYIRIIPEGTGSSTKDAGKGELWGGIAATVGGVALLVASFFTGGSTAGIGISLMGTGIGLICGGAVLLNTQVDVNIPAQKTRTSPTADPMLKGGKNSERQYGSVPVLFGRHLINPDVAGHIHTYVEKYSPKLAQFQVYVSNSNTELTGGSWGEIYDAGYVNNNYIPARLNITTAQYVWGRYIIVYYNGVIQISEPVFVCAGKGIDKTTTVTCAVITAGNGSHRVENQIDITNEFGAYLKFRFLESSSDYYIFENQKNECTQWLVELLCTGYNNMRIETESLKFGDTLVTDLSASKNLETVLSNKDDNVNVEIITDGSGSAIYPKVCHELQINSVLKNKSGTGSSGAIIRTTAGNTTSLDVDIYFYYGLFGYDSKNKIISKTCEIKAWYKVSGASDDDYVLIKDWEITAQKTSTIRLVEKVDGLTAGMYTVKVERITSDSTDSNTVDTVYVGSIRAYTDDTPVSADRRAKSALIALRVKASDSAKDTMDSFNLIAQSVLPDWNETESGTSAWTDRLTKNPASEILYVLRSGINCTPVADEDIDWPAWERFWMFCDVHKYYCNAVLTEDLTLSNLYTLIANVGRGTVVKIDGKFSVIIDAEKTAPVQLFTPRNTRDYKQTYLMADIPDEIDYKFTDETAGWADNTRPIYNTPLGTYVSKPKLRQETTAWGITNPDQLFIFGRYQYGVLNNRQAVHTISCDLEYIMCNKGDLIEYAGDAGLTGVAYGRVSNLIHNAAGNIIGISSDTVLPFTTGDDYGIRVRQRSGKLLTLDCINSGLSIAGCNFKAAAAPDDAPQEGDLFVFGIKGSITEQLIVTDIQADADLNAEITAVDYVPDIFNVDDPDFVIPEFESKLTLGGITDNGTGPSDWHTYTTYNDSREKPAAPSEDGTADGWHRIQTSNSLWVSTKTAQTVSDGVWGDSVQTTSLVQLGVDEIKDGTADDVTLPDIPAEISAVAGMDTIKIACTSFGDGLANAIKSLSWQIRKSADGAWTDIGSSTGTEFTYTFVRSTDGYPEAAALALWTVRARATNIYNKTTAWSEAVPVSTDNYGTWQLQKPDITARISGRAITLFISQPARSDNRTVYGMVKNRLQIKRLNPAADTQFYKPAESADPKASVDNYKNGTGYVLSDAMYQQTMPLYGQNNRDAAGNVLPSPVDTSYSFQITSQNEAGVSLANTITVIALATAAEDIVDAAITHNKLTEGCVYAENIHGHTITADQMAATDLAAAKCTMGKVSGNGLNADLSDADSMWNLDSSAAEFRVGNSRALENSGSDDGEYFHYLSKTETTGLKRAPGIYMKIKNFIVSALASVILGIFRVKMKGAADSASFMTVNPTGSADGTTGTPADTVKINGGVRATDIYANNFYTNGKLLPRYYTVDLSSLSTSNFYPITFGASDNVLDCEIHSPSSVGAAAYNQNIIHFQLIANGWSDTPKLFDIMQYGVFASNEITIGSIGYGTKSGERCVWLRGGMLYRFYCNAVPSLHSADYSYGSSDTEIYTVGTNNSGGTNTNVNIIWTPNPAFSSYHYGAKKADSLAVTTQTASNMTVYNTLTAKDVVISDTMIIPAVTATPAASSAGRMWINTAE